MYNKEIFVRFNFLQPFVLAPCTAKLAFRTFLKFCTLKRL